MERNLTVEKKEAIEKGEIALRALEDVRRELSGATAWSYLDLFGCGNLSGLLKHMKLNKASIPLERAKDAILSFKRELNDVALIDDSYDIDISNLLTFFDFFTDGIIADYLVHRKINEAVRNTENAIYEIKSILVRLSS